MKKRITIDLTDEPSVYDRIVTDAKKQCRSVGSQLLFEVLGILRGSASTTRRAKTKKRATKATA